ncbi:hypothetical protein PS15p_205884 [Mucor circinelloides]
MGLLSFKKKSRKQQQLSDKPFELTNHYQPSPTLPTFVDGSLSTSNTLKIEPSSPRETGTSLMDDIMNELDSAKSISNYNNALPSTKHNKGTRPSPLLIFDSSPSYVSQQQESPSPEIPMNHASTTAATATAAKNPAFMTSQQQLSASTISMPALDNNKTSRTSMQKQQQQQQQQHQQKPKPLLSFSDSNLNLKSLKGVDNDITNQDDFKALVGKSASPPSPMVQQQTQTQTAAPPPAYNVATNNNASRNLMDRMKERHRLEARRSLQPSPFMDNTQAHTNNLSSPSMPIIFSAASVNSPTAATAALKDTRPSPKSLVQSHSFTTYAKPATTPSVTAVAKQRPQQQPLVRSVSDLNDIYTIASRPIQTQSDISLHKRAAPPPPLKQLRISQSPSAINVRNSYLQTGPVMNAAYEEEQAMFCAPMNVSPMRFQLNRSVSAYPSFPQQSVQQQQQMELQQRQQIELQQQQHILQQQKQQHIQQQHIQQQIEIQQQQLQEQQRMQQQKLQQLQIQQQQQQIINQTLLETTAAANAAAAAVAAAAAASTTSLPAPLKISQPRRDAPKTAIVRSESRIIDTKHTSKPMSKYTSATRPLYERSSSSPIGAECTHGRCRQQQYEAQHSPSHCHCHSTTASNNSNRETVLHSSSNVPDTPPPESHHHTIFSKEVAEQASPTEEEKKLTAIEETLIANSSTSTLTEGDDMVATCTTTTTTTTQPNKIKSQLIRLPEKLKQELQSMQLRRSIYSVPDLTTFSSDDDTNATERQKDWSTIEMFAVDSNSGTIANEPIKDSTSITADMNPSQSSPELLMFDSNRHSQISLHLESDSCCAHHHQHHHSHQQQHQHHRHSHHHHKRHRCSKRHETCCKTCSSSSRKHHCSSSKHNSSLNKSFSTYSMDMPASILTASCSHQPGKRHHHHHHHHQTSKHRSHQCHDSHNSRYTLALQDDEDEDVL